MKDTDTAQTLLGDLAIANEGAFWDKDFYVPTDQQQTHEIHIGAPPISTCGLVPEEMGSDLEEVRDLTDANHRGKRSKSRSPGYRPQHTRQRPRWVSGVFVGVSLGLSCGAAGYALGSHATSPRVTSYPIYIEKTVSPPEGVANRTNKEANDGITGTE